MGGADIATRHPEIFQVFRIKAPQGDGVNLREKVECGRALLPVEAAGRMQIECPAGVSDIILEASRLHDVLLR